MNNLNNAVASEIAQGWRVEPQTETQAVLVKGKKVNHLLHLFMFCCTLGLWTFVWIPWTVINRRQVKVLNMHPSGVVQ